MESVDHIRLPVPQLLEGFGGSVFSIDADGTHLVFTQTLGDQLAHGAIGAANNGSHRATPCLRISARSFARLPSSMGVRGRRINSLP